MSQKRVCRTCCWAHWVGSELAEVGKRIGGCTWGLPVPLAWVRHFPRIDEDDERDCERWADEDAPCVVGNLYAGASIVDAPAERFPPGGTLNPIVTDGPVRFRFDELFEKDVER